MKRLRTPPLIDQPEFVQERRFAMFCQPPFCHLTVAQKRSFVDALRSAIAVADLPPLYVRWLDEARLGVRLPARLPQSGEWWPGHRRIMLCPPLVDLDADDSRAFTLAINRVSRAEDLSPQHQRWLAEAEAEHDARGWTESEAEHEAGDPS